LIKCIQIDEKINDKQIEKDEKREPTPPASKNKVSAASLLIAVPVRQLPEGVQWDFDVENWLDPYQVSYYAMDIFEYLKERERLFPIGDYMDRQICLSQWMRALLVDWMVEVQESFELNHETLYLAVKLVDLYLTKMTVGKETLQLLGAASLFIASKFDVNFIIISLSRKFLPNKIVLASKNKLNNENFLTLALGKNTTNGGRFFVYM